MTNKRVLGELSRAALVLSLVFLGCPNDTSDEGDSWSKVTRLEQLDGTWKGSSSQTQTMKEMMEAEGQTEDISMFGDMKVTTSIEITMTINASAKKGSSSVAITQTYSGAAIGAVWLMLREMLGERMAGSDANVSFNDKDHSMTMTSDNPEETMTEEEIAELPSAGFQINKDGTKIKRPAEDSLSEIILIKQ